jgi:hypothetical protein
MLIFFLVGFISIAKLIFSSPDLLVTVSKENINYPSSINEDYSDLFKFIQDSTDNENIQYISMNVYSYLNKTKHQWVLDINNNSSKTIKAINVRLSNVTNLTSWGVSSSYLLNDERKRLMNNIIHQDASGIVYFKDAVDLPPKANLKIYLWGEFNNYDWIESIHIDHENGTAKLEYPESFYGYRVVVANYFFEIFIFLILTFSLIYYLQINNYVTSKEDSSNDN